MKGPNKTIKQKKIISKMSISFTMNKYPSKEGLKKFTRGDACKKNFVLTSLAALSPHFCQICDVVFVGIV